MKKKQIFIGCIGIFLLVLVGFGAFFLGKSKGEKAKEGYYKNLIEEERRYNALLNRSDLEGMGDIKGTIYVAGHKVPDSDTVCSAIGYAALLRQLGYEAVPVVLGPVNSETKYILKKAGLAIPMTLADASGQNLVLVDHSEVVQSADGVEDAKILAIIDHHGDGDITTRNQMIYDSRPIGSVATIVWLKYRDYGLVPDSKTAMAMLGGILSDTKNLKPETSTFADREAVKALGKIADVSDTDAFFHEMFNELLSYEGMTDKEIFLSDYKEYDCSGGKFIIGCIEAYDEETARDLAERMKKTISPKLPITGPDYGFAQISIFHDDISVTYLVPSDEASKEILETAYGDRAQFDGTSFRFEPGISRKKELVPAITEVLEAYPKE